MKINLPNTSFIKFILVGVINTAVGLGLMFLFYNTLDWGYWLSSAVAYVIAGLISYFLNKHFTFKSKVDNVAGLVRFFLLLGICYFIAYSLAKPFTVYLFRGTDFPLDLVEQIALLVGMVFYSILNYFGQRIWVFNRNTKVNR